MRTLLGRADAGAMLALDVYIHRLRKGIAQMAASLGGLDVCVFTGGVGENSADIRGRTAAGLEFLGVIVDTAANRDLIGDGEISADGAGARTLVVAAREDLEMTRQVRDLLR
jgi:acetate kinase